MNDVTKLQIEIIKGDKSYDKNMLSGRIELQIIY